MGAKVAVIGAGITGLSAAYELKRSGVDVSIYERSEAPGGTIRTSEMLGLHIDEGADVFWTRTPEAVELCHELGLGESLISPTPGNVLVWHKGALHPLPRPHFLGVPLEPEKLEPSALVSQEALNMLNADLARTEIQPPEPGETLGHFLRARLGNDLFESVINPIVGSLNDGNCDHLSASASTPQFALAARSHPSLIRGLQEQASKLRTPGPASHATPDGMQTLTDRLAEELSSSLNLRTPVVGIQTGRKSLRVAIGRKRSNFDAVLVATPAWVTAQLVSDWPDARAALLGIDYASVIVITLAYRSEEISGLVPDMGGFVSPLNSGTVINSCSIASQKWPHLAGDYGVLRLSLGRHGNDAVVRADDNDMMSVIHGDLRRILGIEARPAKVRITRWPSALPQYLPGHAARVAKARDVLNPSGVFIAGAAYDGTVIPQCIRSAKDRANEVLRFLNIT